MRHNFNQIDNESTTMTATAFLFAVRGADPAEVLNKESIMKDNEAVEMNVSHDGHRFSILMPTQGDKGMVHDLSIEEMRVLLSRLGKHQRTSVRLQGNKKARTERAQADIQQEHDKKSHTCGASCQHAAQQHGKKGVHDNDTTERPPKQA